MKILFVNALDATVEVETRYPSLGPAYLAGMLRSRFGASTFQFRIIDRNVESVLDKFKPDVVCISAVSQNYTIAARLAAIARKKCGAVFVGGIHISALPDTITSDMDAGCIGEGEETIAELIAILLKKGTVSVDELALVNGIVFRDGPIVRKTPPRELVADLDSIPFPARDLLGIERHTYMFTSRGCPFRCRFCSSSVFWQKTRFFSPDYVVREIEEIVGKFGVRIISFFDDLFIGNISRLTAIVEKIEASDVLKRVAFTCSGRANLIDDKMVSLLKRMRIRSVGMGLESGSEKTLRYLKIKDISVEDNRKAVLALRKGGIAANASFVIGAPDETPEEVLETYRFIKKTPLNLFDTYVLTPYPGTPLWEYAQKKGLVSESIDWSRLNVNFYRNSDRAILLSTTMSRKKLLKMYRKFGRLRLWKNMLNVWSSPQLPDLGSYVYKRIVESLHRFWGKSWAQ